MRKSRPQECEETDRGGGKEVVGARIQRVYRGKGKVIFGQLSRTCQRANVSAVYTNHDDQDDRRNAEKRSNI